MITIWYDMDNTLALFSTKGKESEALEKMHEQGYFENLEVLDGAKSVLWVLNQNGFDVRILSALIDSPFVEQEKYNWLKKHFPFIPDEKIKFVPVGTNKAKAIGDVTNQILVDDYKKNLIEWEKAGGIGVKKRYSDKEGYKYIIRHHREIFPILSDMIFSEDSKNES